MVRESVTVWGVCLVLLLLREMHRKTLGLLRQHVASQTTDNSGGCVQITAYPYCIHFSLQLSCIIYVFFCLHKPIQVQFIRTTANVVDRVFVTKAKRMIGDLCNGLSWEWVSEHATAAWEKWEGLG